MKDLAYHLYWQRKRLLSNSIPHFPLLRWWPTDNLCEIEQVYFQAIQSARCVLDVGAGDLRLMKKFRAAGYQGEYHTQDIGNEYTYTYRDLSEIKIKYDAILCLDVIEHLNLNDGLTLVQQLSTLLTLGGTLILQTPNARCIRNPMGWDITHLHIYNLPDLWSFIQVLGFEANGYRVVFTRDASQWRQRSPCELLRRFVITRVLGADYADNIAVIAKKLL